MFYWVDGYSSATPWAATPGRLIAQSQRPWTLNTQWLRDWLLGCADPAGTPYDGMRRLLPGQRLWHQADGNVVVQDTVGPEVWPEPDLADDEALNTFIDVFDQAVAELAADHAPLTCTLSGGLDSSFMVASAARQCPPTSQVHALTHVPAPEAVWRPGTWVASDEREAAQLARLYRDRVRWQTVFNSSGRGPLDMARQVSRRAWWPAYGPANLEWIDSVHRYGTHVGSPAVWFATHGNAAFSYTHDYAAAPRDVSRSTHLRVRDAAARAMWRRRRGTAQARSSAQFLTEPATTPPPLDRYGYLRWLAGHRQPHAALMNRDAFPIPVVDPFRHPAVLAVAARITPQTWRSYGPHRGFARAASRGRVPDSIRLRRARGAQALDEWHWMRSERARYLDHVEALADTPAIVDLLAISAIRTTVNAWPWGTPEPPERRELSRINRILAFAQFIRDTDERARHCSKSRINREFRRSATKHG